MESVHTKVVTTQETSDTQELKLTPDDRYRLMECAADMRVKSQELQLCRIRLDAAKALSDAESDRILARMGVPEGAQDVTIDTNQGIVSFKVPTRS